MGGNKYSPIPNRPGTGNGICHFMHMCQTFRGWVGGSDFPKFSQTLLRIIFPGTGGWVCYLYSVCT